MVLSVSVFAEGLGGDPIGLLEDLIKVGNRGKTYIVAHRKDGVVGVLQLEGGLLQPQVV